MSLSQAPAEITLYTLPWCGHCVRAKALLNRHGLPYREVDGTGIPGFRRRLRELTGGVTVPQIMIGDTPIGGADRLARLDRLGVLQAMANDEPFPIERELRRISPRSLLSWAAARIRGNRRVSPVRRARVTLDRAGRTIDREDFNGTRLGRDHNRRRT